MFLKENVFSIKNTKFIYHVFCFALTFPDSSFNLFLFEVILLFKLFSLLQN